MVSLDVESLFTNIHWRKLLKSVVTHFIRVKNCLGCCDLLYKNQELSNINKNNFKKLLRAALWNNYFYFDGIVYQQLDEGSYGFPFGPSLS